MVQNGTGSNAEDVVKPITPRKGREHRVKVAKAGMKKLPGSIGLRPAETGGNDWSMLEHGGTNAYLQRTQSLDSINGLIVKIC